MTYSSSVPGHKETPADCEFGGGQTGAHPGGRWRLHCTTPQTLQNHDRKRLDPSLFLSRNRSRMRYVRRQASHFDPRPKMPPGQQPGHRTSQKALPADLGQNPTAVPRQTRGPRQSEVIAPLPSRASQGTRARESLHRTPLLCSELTTEPGTPTEWLLAPQRCSAHGSLHERDVQGTPGGPDGTVSGQCGPILP